MIEGTTTCLPSTGDFDIHQSSVPINDDLNQMLQDVLNSTLIPSGDTVSPTTTSLHHRNNNNIPKNIHEKPTGNNIPISNNLNVNYSKIKNIYSNILFGRKKEIIQSNIIDPLSYLNIDSNNLPFILNISGIPNLSRAENQINLNLSLLPNPATVKFFNTTSAYNWDYPIFIHLPTNSISKEKWYLNENYETLQNLPKCFTDCVLFLETFLISIPNNHIINVCSKCVLREKKRYSRRKSGLCDNILWCNNPNRNAVLFSNKQLFSLQHQSIKHNNLHQLKEINIDLKARVTCYCKHHKNTDSFKILFVIKDFNDNILAKNLSDSIVIMGKKTDISNISKNHKNKTSNVSSTQNFITKVTTPEDSTLDVESCIHRSSAKINKNNNYLIPSPVSSLSSMSSSFSNHTEDNNWLNYYNMKQNQNYKINNFNNHKESINKINFIKGNTAQTIPTSSSNQLNGIPILQMNNANNNTDIPGTFISKDYNNLMNNNSETRKRLKHDHEYHSLSSFSRVSLDDGLTSNTLLNLQQLPIALQDNLYYQRAPDVLPSSVSTLPTLVPLINKVIPSQGPTSGGIEVTLLGSNFKPGQVVKFGTIRALSIQVWNSTTMVTYLPPSPKAGQVSVTIKDPEPAYTSNDINDHYDKNNDNNCETYSMGNGFPNTITNGVDINPTFTYIDTTDSQILQLALQIVGLKMNGRLEDPRNIAKQIIDSASQGTIFETNYTVTHSGTSNNNYSVNTSVSKYQNNIELLLIDVINKTKDFNFVLRDEMGRTLLHYSCLKGYLLLSETLIKISDYKLCGVKDKFGYLPVHFAAINGSSGIIELMNKFNVESNNSSVTINGYTFRDLYNINHVNNVGGSNLNRAESDVNDISEKESFNSEDNGPVEEISPKQTTNVEISESLWNKLMNRFNDDILPKYEDLFPKEYIDYSMNSKMDPTIANIENADMKNSYLETPTTDEFEDQNENDEYFLREMLLFKRNDDFKNDIMLLYFWLPLLVLLSSFILLYIMGSNDDWIHYVSNIISKFFRNMLTKLFVGRENVSISLKNRLSNFQPSKLLEDLPKSIDFQLTA